MSAEVPAGSTLFHSKANDVQSTRWLVEAARAMGIGKSSSIWLGQSHSDCTKGLLRPPQNAWRCCQLVCRRRAKMASISSLGPCAQQVLRWAQ